MTQWRADCYAQTFCSTSDIFDCFIFPKYHLPPRSYWYHSFQHPNWASWITCLESDLKPQAELYSCQMPFFFRTGWKGNMGSALLSGHRETDDVNWGSDQTSRDKPWPAEAGDGRDQSDTFILLPFLWTTLRCGSLWSSPEKGICARKPSSQHPMISLWDWLRKWRAE